MKGRLINTKNCTTPVLVDLDEEFFCVVLRTAHFPFATNRAGHVLQKFAKFNYSAATEGVHSRGATAGVMTERLVNYPLPL